jgi:hypothetical protein
MNPHWDAERVEADAKRDWERLREVREEFPTEQAYVAFKKAEAAGGFSILGQPKLRQSGRN